MAGSDHDFTVTEIKAGVLVVVALAILAAFLVAVRGCWPGGEPTTAYHAAFTDVGGLNNGADVRFGGIKVGRVVDIRPDPEDRTRILVTASVGSEIPVNADSVAGIEQVTLTAEKHLEISTGSAEAPLATNGDRLRSLDEPAGLFDIPDFSGAVHRLETLLDDVIALLGVERVQGTAGAEGVDLARVLADLDAALDEGAGVVRDARTVIVDNRESLQELVAGLVRLEETGIALMEELDAAVAENRPAVRASTENLEKLTARAAERMEQLTETLGVALGHFEDTGGNASDMLDGNRPAIEEILLNLQVVSRDLREFSQTLAEQPHAVIRGKTEHGRTSEDAP